MAFPDDVKVVGDALSAAWDGRTLTVQLPDGLHLQVQPWAPYLVRVELVPPAVPPTVGWALARNQDAYPPDFPVEYREDADGFHLATPQLHVRVFRRRCAVQFEAAGYPGPVAADDPDSPMGTRGDGVWLAKQLRPAQRCFGLGEKVGWLDRRGRRWVMWNRDTLPHLPDSDPLYQSIPFLIVEEQGRFFGLFFPNTHRQHFDLGASRPDRMVFSAEGGRLDYFFIAGPALADVVARYTELTGRAPLPPRWALGFHQSRWGYRSASQVREVAARLRERRIPCDAIYLDLDYMDGFRVFTWHPARFPDPAGLTRELHGQGFRVVAIVDPGVKVEEEYPVYREGRRRNAFCRTASGEEFRGRVWPGITVWPDFARPDVRQWWAEQHRELLDVGVDGIWNDMNEPANFLDERTTGTLEPTVMHGPDDERPPQERRRMAHGEVHNVYGLLMSQAAYEAQLRHRPDRRPFVLTRAGFAGIQRYAAVWTGDNSSWWEHLALMVPQLLNMGLCGLALVGADVGGFTGECTGELMARWTQAAAFVPFFRNHSSMYSPPQEVWRFGEQVEAICRRFIELRYRLLPYLYTLMWEAATTGAPPMRPLFWHYPDDPATYGVQDAFLLGPHLLVAPVTQPQAPFRAVYLPDGEWVYWFRPLHCLGPGPTAVATPLEELPLWVKAAAPVPMGPAVQHTGELRGDGRLAVHVALPLRRWAGDEWTWLYEDDGETFAYRQGEFALRRVRCRLLAPLALELACEPRQGAFRPARASWDAVFQHAPGPPQAVRLDGRTVPEAADPMEPLSHGHPAPGWYYDAGLGQLVVRLPESEQAQTLRVEWSP